MIAPAQIDGHRCEECGYYLRGLTVARCPECGMAFDPRVAPQADIPWLRRAELGLTAAYIGTISMILTQPRRFAAELCRPVRVSANDAYEFRLLTIFIASTSILLALMAYAQYPLRFYPLRMFPVFAMAWIFIAAGLRLVTDLPTFIWRGLPRRARDLSPLHQYACAPLALVPLAAIPFVLAMTVFQGDFVDNSGQVRPGAWILVILPWLPILFFLWRIPLRFMQMATNHRERVRLLAVYLPLHWLIVGGMVGLTVFTIVYFGGELFD